MIDVSTLQGWIEKLGFEVTLRDPTTLHLRPKTGTPIPPFYVQLTENWVLLSVLPMLEPEAYTANTGLLILAESREMRVAKFALDKNGAVVLCAELPTESLDQSEVSDAVLRMTEYARRFLRDFGGR